MRTAGSLFFGKLVSIVTIIAITFFFLNIDNVEVSRLHRKTNFI